MTAYVAEELQKPAPEHRAVLELFVGSLLWDENNFAKGRVPTDDPLCVEPVSLPSKREKFPAVEHNTSVEAQTLSRQPPASTECRNTAKICKLIETMLEDRSGNSEAGADFLRRLVLGISDVDVSLGKGALAHEHPTTAGEAEFARCCSLLADERTARDLFVIESKLGAHPIFNVARGKLKMRMLRNATLVPATEGSVVVLQGDLADAAYVVYRGIVAVHQRRDEVVFGDGQRRDWLSGRVRPSTDVSTLFGPCIAMLHANEAFGENGFVDNGYGRRNATVLAASPECLLIKIARRTLLVPRPRQDRLMSFADAPHAAFLRVLRKAPQDRDDDDIEAVLHHCSWQPVFASLEPPVARVACRQIKLVSHAADEVIVLQGDIADAYFIIYHGAADVFVASDSARLFTWKGLHLWERTLETPEVRIPAEVAGTCVFKLTQGMAFGESGLDPAGPGRRNATIVSNGAGRRPLLLLALYRADLQPPKISETQVLDDLSASLINSSLFYGAAKGFQRARCIVKLDRRGCAR